jgi:hypothetical protein
VPRGLDRDARVGLASVSDDVGDVVREGDGLGTLVDGEVPWPTRGVSSRLGGRDDRADAAGPQIAIADEGEV